MRGFFLFALLADMLAGSAAPNAEERLAGTTTPPVVFAQGGSTGGSIGKQDKAVSGSRERTLPDRPAAAPKPNDGMTSLCGKMSGVWSWFTGGDVVIRSSGTASTGSLTATWTCKSNQVVMVWSHGFTDRLTISSDGNRLSGSNGFVTVSGHRK